MADHGIIHHQLPIMVRNLKPKMVWSGLVKIGLYQREIAGDGNCLFASLSDQLYGTSVRHPEIRANIIEHMRQNRPQFELYVHKDDVQQRRALRERTVAARRPAFDDTYEEYLALMSRGGTYGGEPELVAFCQVYDQDVTVHLPVVGGHGGDSIPYTNEQRVAKEQAIPLHICYGGDEVTRAHYDSARSRNTPFPKKQAIDRSERRRSHAGLITLSKTPQTPTPPPDVVTSRSQRQSRSDLTPEQFAEILAKGRRDIELGLGQLRSKERPRSSSISSSHRSSSSKRSLDDDGEPSRTTKRADRRKSMKSRTKLLASSPEHDPNLLFKLRVDSPGPETPNSTQDTEYSSDQADLNETGSNVDDDYHDNVKTAESSDTDESLDEAMAAQGSQRKRAGVANRTILPSLRGVSGRTGMIAAPGVVAGRVENDSPVTASEPTLDTFPIIVLLCLRLDDSSIKIVLLGKPDDRHRPSVLRSRPLCYLSNPSPCPDAAPEYLKTTTQIWTFQTYCMLFRPARGLERNKRLNLRMGKKMVPVTNLGSQPAGNLAIGAFMILGGILEIVELEFHTIILGIYVIIFGLAVAGLELVPNIPPYLPRYASFLFSFLGRGIFYIFVGMLVLEKNGWPRILTASVIGLTGVAYCALEFVPQVEPPSNMRDAGDAGWGAEQV